MPSSLTVLPFMPVFRPLVKSGEKTATARTKPYGKEGDYLAGPGCTLRLTYVAALTLAHIAEHYWHEEGCASPEAFKEVWCEIHPNRGWVPEQVVFFHRFEVVG